MIDRAAHRGRSQTKAVHDAACRANFVFSHAAIGLGEIAHAQKQCTGKSVVKPWITGVLLLARNAGDAGDAESSLVTAIDVAREQNARWSELRAAMGLARLWAKAGERHKARDLLFPVYDWFTEGFDTPDLKDAKALLDALA